VGSVGAAVEGVGVGYAVVGGPDGATVELDIALTALPTEEAGALAITPELVVLADVPRETVVVPATEATGAAVVGVPVGVAVGALLVGVSVGVAVGSSLGGLVGVAVGTSVGARVGVAVVGTGVR